MPSSDARAGGTVSGAPGISSYAFEQLDAPAGAAAGPVDILTAAAADAEDIRARARQAGEAEGRAAGLAAAQAELVPALATLREAAGSLAALTAERLAAVERDAVELSLQLSEQIVQAAVDVQPELLLGVTRTALRRLADRHRVTVAVNPDDLELLSDGIEQLKHELGGIEHLDVHSDRRVGRGGAVARTEEGEIDASIEAQLRSAREIAIAALRGEDAADGQ
jgi:flagellar assembly protein FliH